MKTLHACMPVYEYKAGGMQTTAVAQNLQRVGGRHEKATAMDGWPCLYVAGILEQRQQKAHQIGSSSGQCSLLSAFVTTIEFEQVWANRHCLERCVV